MGPPFITVSGPKEDPHDTSHYSITDASRDSSQGVFWYISVQRSNCGYVVRVTAPKVSEWG